MVHNISLLQCVNNMVHNILFVPLPTVLDRQRSLCKEKSKEKLKRSDSCQEMGPGSFQISTVDGSQPLLVFVKPKSGGRQGAKLYRKFL